MPFRASPALAAALTAAVGLPWAAPAPAWARAAAAASSPTVDAFLDLPSRYVDLTAAERRRVVSEGGRRLIARDDRNGYLAIGGDGASPGFTVTVFRTAGAQPVVAVQRSDELHRRTWFLQRRGAGWEDVSAKIVPGYALEGRYTLPRYGVVLVADGAPLTWRNGRFAAATGRSQPPGELPFAGTWRVTAVRLRPGPVQALRLDDRAYMGAVLDASPAQLAWRVKPQGGTLDDVCQGPKLRAGAVTCTAGAFGPPGAHVEVKPSELDLDWYDNAQLVLRRGG